MAGRHRPGSLLGLSALLVVSLPCARSVRAQDAFQWSAPASCASREVVLAEVERLLAGPLRLGDRAIVGAIVSENGELRLELALTGPDGVANRSLRGESCEALIRAGALLIALAIDPEAVASTQAAERVRPEGGTRDASPSDASPSDASPDTTPDTPPVAPTPGMVASPSTQVDAPIAPSTREIEARAGSSQSSAPDDDISRGAPPLRFVGSLYGALSVGPLPSASPGGAISLGLGIDVVELSLGAAVLAEQSAQAETGAGGTFGAAFGRLRACLSLEPDAWVELLPCLAFEAGAIWGRGLGVPVTRAGTAPWLAAAGGLEVRFYPVESLAISAFADLQVPFVRGPFVLTLDGVRAEVHRSFEVGGLFGLGLTVRLR